MKNNWVWAYHVTLSSFLHSIAKEGLKPNSSVKNCSAIFVEPDLAGVQPYVGTGTAVLRFKTPGFSETRDGESVLFAGSTQEDGIPDAPFVGNPGEVGVIPPSEIQLLVDKKWKNLI
jgi:hypothetical protein